MSDKQRREIDDDLSIHIFNASATLVGVTLPAIGIFKVVEKLKTVVTIADELVALNALIFVVCCAFAYLALKTRKTKRKYLEEKISEILFFIGLSSMVLICILLSLALI